MGAADLHEIDGAALVGAQAGGEGGSYRALAKLVSVHNAVL
jgi:hypothetical protein